MAKWLECMTKAAQYVAANRYEWNWIQVRLVYLKPLHLTNANGVCGHAKSIFAIIYEVNNHNLLIARHTPYDYRGLVLTVTV